MSADVLFTSSRGWSVTSPFFKDLMQRCIWKCHAGEGHLVEKFSLASEVHCFSVIDRDVRLQVELTERLIEAAVPWIEDLRQDAATHPDEIVAVENLVLMAREHLADVASRRV